METEMNNGLLTYRRRCEGRTFERVLVSKTGEFIINPVEPHNLPEDITNFLQIEFPPIVVEPGATQTVYLKFPIEMGVFLESAKDIRVLDIFGLGSQKFTLYGSPTDGLIARWYKSEIYPEIPPVEPLREGVMELSIHNAYTEWAEVSYAVFDTTDMKIYYDEIVAISASMKIIARTLAETNFADKPLRPGMAKAIELHVARKIPMIDRGYLMEWGY